MVHSSDLRVDTHYTREMLADVLGNISRERDILSYLPSPVTHQPIPERPSLIMTNTTWSSDSLQIDTPISPTTPFTSVRNGSFPDIHSEHINSYNTCYEFPNPSYHNDGVINNTQGLRNSLLASQLSTNDTYCMEDIRVQDSFSQPYPLYQTEGMHHQSLRTSLSSPPSIINSHYMQDIKVEENPISQPYYSYQHAEVNNNQGPQNLFSSFPSPINTSYIEGIGVGASCYQPYYSYQHEGVYHNQSVRNSVSSHPATISNCCMENCCMNDIGVQNSFSQTAYVPLVPEVGSKFESHSNSMVIENSVHNVIQHSDIRVDTEYPPQTLEKIFHANQNEVPTVPIMSSVEDHITVLDSQLTNYESLKTKEIPIVSNQLSHRSPRTRAASLDKGTRDIFWYFRASPEERFAPIPKPIVMTTDPKKFCLDLTFNRLTNLNKRYPGYDIAPEDTYTYNHHQTIDELLLIPSDIDDYACLETWRSFFQTWSFPIRSDAPRGLTWGPYYELPINDYSSSLYGTGTRSKKRAWNLEVKNSKRVKIFPILKIPTSITTQTFVNKSPSVIKFNQSIELSSTVEPIKQKRIRSSSIKKNSAQQFKRGRIDEALTSPRKPLIIRLRTKPQVSLIKINQNLKPFVDVIVSPSKPQEPLVSKLKPCFKSPLTYGR